MMTRSEKAQSIAKGCSNENIPLEHDSLYLERLIEEFLDLLQDVNPYS